MKARTKFLKMYYKLPERARANLVWNPYGINPMSLNVCFGEIFNKTRMGKELLKEMGFENE